MSSLEQRTDHILETLGPYGLPKSGAKALARLPGITALLEQESLTPNPGERPRIITPINGKADVRQIDTRLIRNDYRQAAANYLRFWIKDIDPLLTWPTYQALVLYCESKVQQQGAKVTA